MMLNFVSLFLSSCESSGYGHRTCVCVLEFLDALRSENPGNEVGGLFAGKNYVRGDYG